MGFLITAYMTLMLAMGLVPGTSPDPNKGTTTNSAESGDGAGDRGGECCPVPPTCPPLCND